MMPNRSSPWPTLQAAFKSDLSTLRLVGRRFSLHQLLEPLLAAIQRSVSASSTKKVESPGNLESRHVSICMHSRPNSRHSSKLSEATRYRLCLAALSTWDAISDRSEHHPWFMNPAMEKWPRLLPEFPDSYGMLPSKLPESARRGRDYYTKWCTLFERRKSQAVLGDQLNSWMS